MEAPLKLTSGERKQYLSSCPLAFVCEAFNISRQAVHQWVDSGCPRNPDNSFSLTDVIAWRFKKEADKSDQPGTLKEEKLKKEIEFLQTRIDEKNNTTIDRSLHETIMVSRAGSLRTHLEKTTMSNAVHLAGKTVDEVRTILYKLIQAAMEAYIGKSEDD
jgi:hypothetical protein